ncbi:MAG: APC family permease [Bdellovibrionales bacterium]|nr:APC family permease [Bdellovibrionales bacterium]
MALLRTLRLPMLTFYGTGMILGAGIYSIIGKAAGIAGESLWQGFLLAGIAALLTALSYAELATMYPTAGGEYIYLRKAFSKNRWVAGTIGNLVIFAGCASAATVALAFSSYLQHFITLPSFFVASVILIIFTVINMVGINQSSLTNAIFTIIEIVGLVIFIWLGSIRPEFGKALTTIPTLATVSSAALIIFAFLGFENIVSLAEETILPEKNIPQAIFLSLTISTVLYIFVSLAAVVLMPIEQLALTESALLDASLKSSQNIAGILGGIALFSTANTVLIALVTTSRIIYGISKDNSLPQFLSKTLNKKKTPWAAALVAMLFAVFLLPFGKVETLASIASFSTMIVFIAVNIALIHLRQTDSKINRPFRVPCSIGSIPVLPVLGIIVCITFLFQFNTVVYLTGLFSICSSAGIYFSHRYFLNRSER